MDDVEVVVALVVLVGVVVVVPEDWPMPQMGCADCLALLRG